VPYRLRESEKAVLVDLINTWIDDESLVEIAVDRKVGRRQTQAGMLQGDELASLADSAAILDEITDRWGQSGGKWQLRARFGPYQDDGTPARSQKRTFDMIRTAAAERTQSRGHDAGFESLAGSFSSGFDALQRQLSAQVESQQSLTASILERSDAAHITRLAEATEFQRTIMSLQNELTALRIQAALADREPLIGPEVLQAVLPVIVQLGTAAAHKLSGVAPPAAPEVAPAPE
jgi:hypothetical protein